MIDSGTAALRAGTIGLLQAPLATTRVRHWIAPPLVLTR